MFCLQFRVRSAPGTHTFSVVSGTAFRLLHMLDFLAPGASFSRNRFGCGSQLLKRSVSKGPGPFFGLRAARFEGRVLLTVQNHFGFGSQFYKNIVMVRDRFGSGSQFLEKIVINGPEPFWLREPVFREVCYLRSGTVLGSGCQVLKKSVFVPGACFGKFAVNGPGPFLAP